jgi:hypothetical protein
MEPDMKQVVLHTTPCVEPTTVASARVAQFLARRLDIPLVAGSYKDNDVQKYDHVFYVNSMGAFATPEFRTFMKVIVRNCGKLIYVQNDYTIHPISQTQKAMRDRGWSHDFPFEEGPILWTTVPDMMCKPQDSYVNWNRLTYNPCALVPANNRVQGLLYWGSYRLGRIPSFKKYFEQNLYPVHLAMSPRVLARFAVHDMDNNLVRAKPWKFADEISGYQATLYIEDEQQHDGYHSPPNRVYEALSAGVALFIDKPCVPSLLKANLAVKPEWVVDSPSELASKLPNFYQVAMEQRSIWGESHVAQTWKEVREAYAKL